MKKLMILGMGCAVLLALAACKKEEAAETVPAVEVAAAPAEAAPAEAAPAEAAATEAK